MKRYPFPNTRPWQSLFALYLFALLYLTRVSQVSHYLLGFYKAQALTVGITAIAVLTFLLYQRKNLKDLILNGRMVLTLVLCAGILTPMLLKRDYTMMYLSVLFSGLLGIFLSYFVSCRRAAKYYVLLLAGLALYSLAAFFLLRPLSDLGLLRVPTFQNAYGAEFYNYLFSFVSVTFARERNFGIFREPGVYQFFLFLALYLNNYQADWDSGKQTWGLNALLVTAMLTTFSTCGVAVTAVFLIALYFDRKVYDTPLGRKLSLMLFVLLALAAAWLVAAKPPLYTQLKLMVEKLFTSNPSLNDRIDCIKFNLYVIQWDRFTGRELAYILETVTHNTSSSTILFGILGLFFGWLNLFGWVTLVFRGRGHLPMKLVCLVTLAATFNTENLITNPYFWLFPILALTEGLLPLANAPRKNLRKA